MFHGHHTVRREVNGCNLKQRLSHLHLPATSVFFYAESRSVVSWIEGEFTVMAVGKLK